MFKKIVYVLAFLFLLSEVSFSAPGDLDLTFSSGGVFTYDGSDIDEGSGVAIQEDGKVVIVGKTVGASSLDALVLRLNPDGGLDNTFGGDGVVTYDGGGHDRGYAIAIQKDGKIVVAGYSHKDTDDVLVLRYNSDGTLDNTFGGDGVVTYDSGSIDLGNGIAIQEDGKIVVVGYTTVNGTYDVLVLRYNPDGTLDNTFGDNGVVTYDGGYVDVSNGVAIQENGEIVVAGERYKSNSTGTVSDVLVLRYNPDGTLDNTFSGDGVAIYDSGNLETGTGIAIQEDGKIIIAGVTYNSSRNALVLRLNANGTVDKTFGENGIVNYHGSADNDDWGIAVAIQRDGNIIIIGRSYSNYQYDVLALRLHGGDPDKTPPTPNPMTWAEPPDQTGTNSISMVAITADDPTPPINYYFDFVSSPTGGLGGKDSGWQAGTSYTNSNLQANHKYGYRVKAKDGLNNQTAYSTTQYPYTAIQAPTGITFGTVTPTSIQVRSTNTPSGLSRGSSGLLIENTTLGIDSGWKRSNLLWTNKVPSPNTSYTFQAKARNGDEKETDYGPSASKYTRANLPKKDSFSDVKRTSIRANWTANDNPPGTKYQCQNVTTGAKSAWTTDTFWDSNDLACSTFYSFRVKAKNEEGIETGWTSLGSQSTVKCILLLKPNGGEMISSGSSYDILWEATPAAESFDLFYSLDSGVSWISIAPNVGNTIYSWSVPKTIGNKKACLVKVIGYNVTRTKKIGYDTSDKPFTIEVVTVLKPNGGEILHAGEDVTIEWRGCSDAVKFDLMISLDNGVTWRFIDDENTPGVIEGKGVTGTTLTTKVPSPGTGNKTACLIKVIAYDAAGKQIGSDTSDKSFTIEVVKLTSPNGGPPPLKQNDRIDITWTAYETSEPITKVQLFYTKDGGANWNLIITLGAYPPGSYIQPWIVPPVGTAEKKKCKVKVVLKDAKGVIRGGDVSDNYFTIEPLLPDLIETSVSNPPATDLIGGSFSATDTVSNQGEIDARPSITRYYLSVDTFKDSGDILLTGSRSVPKLVPGVTSTGAANVTIPSSTAVGVYYLLACADDTKVVAEGNETNNCIASGSTVQVRAPDLIETSITNPPATASVGSSFSVTDTAKNQGNADAGSSTTQYYLSVDKTKGSGDILLKGTRSVPSLAPGVTSTDKVDVTIPSNLAARAYYLLACADDMKVVAESNETNNCIASTSTVQVSGPDLIETFVSNPPPAVKVGKSFSVTDTVKNQGNVDAGPSATQYYLSVDKIKSNGDVLLIGGRYVIGLAPGTSFLGWVDVTIPFGTAGVAYYLLACADDMEAVDETDETNNCIASGTQVQVFP